jgi:predicted Zn-dependent protease
MIDQRLSRPQYARYDRMKRLFGALLLILSMAVLAVAQEAAQPQAAPRWSPPPPRAKNSGPYAPAPPKGINYFEGEAEKWLADDIEKLTEEHVALLNNAAIVNYVWQVGLNVGRYSVIPDRAFRFILIDSEEPNATSIGDGRIFVSLGLLRVVESEDELAGVLAHEMAHDAYRHVPKTISRQLFWLTDKHKIKTQADVDEAVDKLLSAYEQNKLAMFMEKLSGISRLDELKADQKAFYTTYRAGYNPLALIDALERIDRENEHPQPGAMSKVKSAFNKMRRFFLGTHPLTLHRSLALQWEAEFVNKLPAKDSRYASPAFDAMKAEVARIAPAQ